MNDLYLVHHGIKGQRWGIRRFQNPDGTLTARGKKRISDKYGELVIAKNTSKAFTDRYKETGDNDIGIADRQYKDVVKLLEDRFNRKYGELVSGEKETRYVVSADG